MKSFIVVCFFTLAALACARPDEKYTDKYDTVDLDEVLSNRRLLIPYIKCGLEEGRCAPDAKELKEHLREALENACDKCTEAQRKGTRRVIKHLINNEPDYWNQLSAKYDPERKYSNKYEKELREIMS